MDLNKLSDDAFRKTYVTVTEFARLVGLSAQTLRNYDRQGIFKPDYVTPSGRRLYNLNQVTDCKALGKRSQYTEQTENQNQGINPFKMINLSVSVSPDANILRNTKYNLGKYDIEGIEEELGCKSCVVYTLTKYLNDLKDDTRLKEILKDYQNITYSDVSEQLNDLSNLNGISSLIRFLSTNRVSEILVYLKHETVDENKILEVLRLISKAYSIPLFEI